MLRKYAILITVHLFISMHHPVHDIIYISQTSLRILHIVDIVTAYLKLRNTYIQFSLILSIAYESFYIVLYIAYKILKQRIACKCLVKLKNPYHN